MAKSVGSRRRQWQEQRARQPVRRLGEEALSEHPNAAAAPAQVAPPTNPNIGATLPQSSYAFQRRAAVQRLFTNLVETSAAYPTPTMLGPNGWV